MIVTLLSLGLLAAETTAEIPKPPTSTPVGVLSIWGTPAMEAPAREWIRGFQLQHPDIKIELKLAGTDVGMSALSAGVADIVLMGRQPTSSEVKAFEWIFRYRPSLLPIAKGSVQSPGQSPQVAILVHPDNPIRSFTAKQLEEILLRQNLTWKDLGASGPRADHPVRVYMPHAESGTGRFIREAVAGGDIRLDWQRVTEFSDPLTPGHVDRASLEASLAVRGDLDGIAFGLSGVGGTKRIEVPFESQLERLAYAVANVPPGGCLDPEVRLFLTYATSPKGSRMLVQGSSYRRLPAALSAESC